MKRIVIVALPTLGTLWACAWLIVSLRAKQNYDLVRRDLLSAHYAEAPMDRPAKAFLSHIENHWTPHADTVGGLHSDVVSLAGMTPTVSNLIRVMNYQMPKYQWFALAQNEQAAVMGLLKANFFPSSVDRAFHVSEDQHLAFLWCKTNVVYVYRDETNGLRATLYVTKTNDSEQRPDSFR